MENIMIDSISHYYTDEKVLDNINLELKKGEFFTLLGPSGCGKTTILRILGGFINPTKGKIYVGKNDITNIPPEKRNMGTVFQNYALFPNMNVEENISYGLKIKKFDKITIRKKCDKYLNLVGLEKVRNKKINELSGGQQQRVAIARALITEPTMLLLDEPLSNLDVALREKMRDEIKSIQKKIGITTLFITHDQQEALAVSDRIAVMNKGKVLQVGTPQEIYNNPIDEFVSNFVGKSNIIESDLFNKFGIKNKKDKLFIRPEYMNICKRNCEKKTIKGIVVSKVFLGATIEYTIKCDVRFYHVTKFNKIENEDEILIGDEVYLGIDRG